MARMHARLTGSDELEMGELDSFKHQASILFIHVQSVLCALARLYTPSPN